MALVIVFPLRRVAPDACLQDRGIFFYFLPFIMHLPMALHLAGLGQAEQALNAAGFLAAAALAAGFLPYIITNLLEGLTILRRFLRYRFWLRHKLFALAVAFRLGPIRSCFF